MPVGAGAFFFEARSMKREDFIFTVGFQGNTAIVDKKAQRSFRGSSIDELLAEELFGAAFRAAIFDSDDSAIERIRLKYNESFNADYESAMQLKRLFGVDVVPEDVSRIRAL